MSMTTTEKYWHQVYEDMPPAQQKVVDDAYNEVRRVLEWDGRFTPANDDRAEALVASITQYYVEGLSS